MSAPRHSVRARALQAASDVLVEQGRDALSIRAIAARAKIGVASLYHYFANKDQLLVQLALSGFADLARTIAEPPAEVRGQYPFDRAARAYFAFIARKPAVYRLMYDHDLMRRHDAIRAGEQAAFDIWAQQVAADHRFPADRATSIALTLWTLGRGVAVSAASQPGAHLDEASRGHILDGLAYLIDRQA